MFKKVLHALAIGSAAVGVGALAEFGLGKAMPDAPKAVKVGAKFAGAGIGAGVAVAVLKS